MENSYLYLEVYRIPFAQSLVSVASKVPLVRRKKAFGSTSHLNPGEPFASQGAIRDTIFKDHVKDFAMSIFTISPFFVK